ncbi:MAG: homogentisate 1,2-dioxygenase [Alphaproteobacteria bacterium]|nr:homogentisate 1,2-dioxygenase [Alphaproteobacteria bacterium]
MADKWIPLPRIEGEASRQAHADLPEGTYEREFGKEGFFGPATQIYHRNPPTGWIDWQGPLRPRAFDTTKIEHAGGGPWQARPLLENVHCKVRAWRQETAMADLARNADGDELIFVHEGAGELYCDFGHLSFRDGDYIVLPKTTTWRIEPTAPVSALLVEATNQHYTLPERGLVSEQAIFDPAVLETPRIDAAYEAQQDDRTWRIEIKARGQVSTVTYPYNPLDTAGWQGSVAPVKLNWRDIRPLMSHRYHVPPSAHTTFMGGRFVVCTFVPRPFESDPGALKVPFFHSNNDYDEVIFYHAGEFFSRDNIHPGMMTLHPAGFPHGPHPKALANAFEQKRAATDEVAVMIDTRDPLEIRAEAEALEWTDYVDSWGAANRRGAKAAE